MNSYLVRKKLHQLEIILGCCSRYPNYASENHIQQSMLNSMHPSIFHDTSYMEHVSINYHA